jgi:hypothetical protein
VDVVAELDALLVVDVLPPESGEKPLRVPPHALEADHELAAVVQQRVGQGWGQQGLRRNVLAVV